MHSDIYYVELQCDPNPYNKRVGLLRRDVYEQWHEKFLCNIRFNCQLLPS